MQPKFGSPTLQRLLKAVLVALLIVFEIIIGAQYGSLPKPEDKLVTAIVLAILFVVVAVVGVLIHYARFKSQTKTALFAVAGVCLIASGFITGNEYLPVVWCLLLTHLYIGEVDIRKNIVLAVLSFAFSLSAYVWGWVILNRGTSDYETTMTLLSGSIVSLVIFGFHFIVINFVTRYYRMNLQLRKALQEAEENKEALSRAYEKLAETAVYEERNRIAKDIHDTAGHSMTAIIMQTEAAKLLIDSNPEEAKNRLISANMQAKTALEQMRESVHLLAGRTTGGSIKTAIEEIAAQTMDGTDVKVRCDVEDIVVSAEQERLLCNSVKECLVNGIRHGGATAFYVEFRCAFQELQLLVSDNGTGFSGEVKEGFGLTGMRHNVEKLGGTLIVKSEADEGTEVSIYLPLNKKEDNHDQSNVG